MRLKNKFTYSALVEFCERNDFIMTDCIAEENGFDIAAAGCDDLFMQVVFVDKQNPLQFPDNDALMRISYIDIQ